MSSEKEPDDVDATIPYDMTAWSLELEESQSNQKLSGSSGNDSTPSQRDLDLLNSAEPPQRLFRNRSDYMSQDHSGIMHPAADDSNPLKYGHYNSEAYVTTHNFRRGTSDLLGMASNLPLQGYTDVAALRGKIDARSRHYLTHGVDKHALLQPLSDSSFHSGSTDKGSLSGSSLAQHSSSQKSHLSQPSSTEERPRTGSLSSSTSSVDPPIVISTFPQERIPLSYHPALSPIADIPAESVTSPAHDGSSPSPSSHQPGPSQPPIVESTFPLQDEETKQVLQAASLQGSYATQDPATPAPTSQGPLVSKRKVQQRKLRSQNSTTLFQAPLPTSRRRQYQEAVVGVCVLFSSNLEDKQVKKCTRLASEKGATVVDAWDKCTHFVTNEFRRTINSICAYSSGKEIVTTRWLEDAAHMSGFPDTTSYRLCPVVMEPAYNQCRFYFTQKALHKIKRPNAQQLTKANGAKMVAQLPQEGTNVVVVGENKKDLALHVKKGRRTLVLEALMNVGDHLS
ncbi:hypothetical protein DM01DRAFT_1338627 [Hesseltinella vesiculosa]|uniref:BRCT domain-containing protein n=1 Tax=Hesseltinella vesiculosa TaxID=101127 RepID=A0A1X2G9N2_9FUNG|nr:hypothetical protein DM01DRAFT_1338627 [Hesseltinella vesiculosa]